MLQAHRVHKQDGNEEGCCSRARFGPDIIHGIGSPPIKSLCTCRRAMAHTAT